MPIDPNTGQEQQPAQSLLDLYGGRNIGQVVQGGGSYVDIPGGAGMGGTFEDWANLPATNQLVSDAITRGGRYQPDFARQVQSSGPEGGFFSIPGTQPETNLPWGMGGAGQALDWGPNPAPGLVGMSTNNQRLLPKEYQSPPGSTPRWTMRAGHIIDQRYADKPWQFQWEKGAEAPWGLGGPGHGFPVSHGSPSQRGYFFPGQLEPEVYEGGSGTY